MGAAVFDGRGVYIGGKMYSYTDTEVTLHTDNSFHHVNISFVFSFCDRQSLYIPVSAESITMLEQFGIEPQNRGLLYALRYDTYETVKNIYYGKQV